jgi:hypothetical protein
MDTIIGRVTVKGTDEEVAALTPFVTKATTLLGTRIDPFNLLTRERSKMPVYGYEADGTPLRARGHWSSRLRRMLVSKDLFQKGETLERDKVLGHEFVHVIFSDWMGKWHRRQLLPVIQPPADSWNDLTIGDKYEGYFADPSEALACYGSAALFGWAKPAYASIYLRRITQENFPKTKTILLSTAP